MLPNLAPWGEDLITRKRFKKLNLKKVKKEIAQLLKTSQDWWRPTTDTRAVMVRMSWHSAGTYRVSDGRGGAGGGQLRLSHSIAGGIIRTSIKHDDCYGY